MYSGPTISFFSVYQFCLHDMKQVLFVLSKSSAMLDSSSTCGEDSSLHCIFIIIKHSSPSNVYNFSLVLQQAVHALRHFTVHF